MCGQRASRRPASPLSPKGGAQIPKLSDVLYICSHGRHAAAKFCTVVNPCEREIITWSITPPRAGPKLLLHEANAVANLVVCRSVCLCPMPGHGVKTQNGRMNRRTFFTLFRSIILLFQPNRCCKIPSVNGAIKYTGIGMFAFFRPKAPFISETVRDRPVMDHKGNRSSWSICISSLTFE